MFSYVFMKILEGRPRSYDRIMDKVSRGRVRAAKEAVAAETPAGAHVLEIGCGTGELAEMLVGMGSIVEGFDLSPSMIEAARERIDEHGLGGKLSVRQMGVDGMDTLPNAAYDAVVSTLVLSELNPDELGYALRHARRVMKQGGTLVIADEVVPRSAPNRALHAAARAPVAALTYLVSRSGSRPIADLAGELVRAGFRVEKEERSQADAFAVVVARPVEEEVPS